MVYLARGRGEALCFILLIFHILDIKITRLILYMKKYHAAKNKYHAKSVTYNGLAFDSQKEALRYKELTFLMTNEIITDLRRQVKFILIPAQREPAKIGKRGGIKQGKLIERECSYIADFVYTVRESGETVVEDTKGFKTKDYVIKRKLMLFVYGIRIREI